MIYLSETPPSGWCATSFTYVPNINNYDKPTYSWGDASIIPMIAFGENEFVYTGNIPQTTWTNNIVGYEASLEMPTLQKDVGKYQEIIPVTFTKGDESFTINITYNYEIKPAVLTATVNDYSKVYGDPDPSFSVSFTGFINGEDESVISQYPIAKTDAYIYKVGKYPIRISGGEAKNYMFDYKDGELTIVPRVLSVSVGNYQREYNKDNPYFVLTYDGFVGNDRANSSNISPNVSTTATRMSEVGVYPITISGGSYPNYTLSYSDGSLTITKAEQNVEWKQNLERLFVGDQVELLAKGSSNQPIKYIIDETDCAELYNAGNKTYLNCKKAGRFQIKAIQEGNANYYSSQMANNTAIIFGIGEDDPTLTIKQCDYGTISAQVIKGSSYEFSIKSEKGWKIHSVSFNNSDVTSKIIDGYLYKTPEITYNSTLSVVYEKDNNDVIFNEEESQVKIYSMTFGIRVKDAQPSEIVEVYSPDGILIKSVKVENSIMDVLLTKGKMYVVKVGQKIVKLSI